MLKQSAIVTIWLFCVGAALYWLGWRTSISSDLSQMMPVGKDAVAELLLDELRDGIASRTVLIGLSGGSEVARADLSKRLTASLTASGLLRRVENGSAEVDESVFRMVPVLLGLWT